MKVKNKEDIQRLDEKIKSELGIDVRKYRDDDVAEDFMDLLLFPKYFASWVLPSIGLMFVLFLLGFFFVDLANIEYLVYAFFGFFLFIGTGLFLGLLLFTWQLKSDLENVADYAMNTMKAGISDVGRFSNNMFTKDRNVLGMLFKGIIFIVTIPMMKRAINKKVPWLAFAIVPLFNKILGSFSECVDFDEEPLRKNIEEKEPPSTIIKTFDKVVEKANTGIGNALSKTLRVAQIPLQIGFVISLLLLTAFLYLIW
ncbi:MAG: hypothetical protein AB8F74_15125 [Saprospiraceae bacterium]